MKNITPNTTPEPGVDRAFLDLLTTHRRGDCMHELGQAIREATKATTLTGKPATVTLKLKIATSSQIAGAILVSDDVTLKTPREDKGGSLDYAEEVSASGNLAGKPGSIELPPVVSAAIDIFEGGAKPYLVNARLKVRVEGRKLQLWFETVDRNKLVRDAVLKTVAQVAEKTGIIPLLGQP